MRLVDAPNTYNPALIVLSEMGCVIGIRASYEEEMGLWYAEIDGNEFEASDPLSLLGLITIWKHRGAEWRRSEDNDIYDKILDDTYGE